jgi:MoaA/NifB/PqqE/SkfB family radical SAM enzyme
VSGKKEVCLAPSEISSLCRTINKFSIKNLLFIGGEPTLYIPDIQSILSRLDAVPEVWITTNGHFAETVSGALSMLSSIPGLAGVNLSYDSFHKKFLSLKKLKNLKTACGEKGVGFKVFLALRSPMDLMLVGTLRDAGVKKVVLQKLLPSGTAKDNNLSYQYPSFDKAVLSQFCPNRNKIIYLCGQGYTSCCAKLVFDSNSRIFFRPTLRGFLNSDFGRLISSSTFGDIQRRFKLRDLVFSPEHSAPCVLCEYLFRSRYGNKL